MLTENASTRTREDELLKLKRELGSRLTDPDRLKTPEGIPTGNQKLDHFLLWHGFPKGALTALTGEFGLGGTSLWLGAAAHVLRQGKWVAWVEHKSQLVPLNLWQQNLDLSRFVTITAPESEEQLLWLLQTLMESSLFDLIGCDLPTMPRAHQIRKLQSQARLQHIALVFFADCASVKDKSLFSLLVDFRPREISVERALHRPTPLTLPRRITYASFTLHSRARDGIDSRDRNKCKIELKNALVHEAPSERVLEFEPYSLFDPGDSSFSRE